MFKGNHFTIITTYTFYKSMTFIYGFNHIKTYFKNKFIYHFTSISINISISTTTYTLYNHNIKLITTFKHVITQLFNNILRWLFWHKKWVFIFIIIFACIPPLKYFKTYKKGVWNSLDIDDVVLGVPKSCKKSKP